MKNSETDEEEQNYIGGIFQRIDSFIVVREFVIMNIFSCYVSQMKNCVSFR